ncbi:hypothetical protein EJB05_27059, partial [Eragrostis curvula]
MAADMTVSIRLYIYKVKGKPHHTPRSQSVTVTHFARLHDRTVENSARMSGDGDDDARPPHVAMLVTPGMGHLIPLAELAKHLASRHGVTSTLLTFASTASATQRAFLASLPPGGPLFAEQRQNAVMLAAADDDGGAGAAIRLPAERKDKETIAAAVRELMEGEGKGAAVRQKVAELQKAAKESLREGGAATVALDELVGKWKVGGN